MKTENRVKKEHPVAGLILGVLGIALALLFCMLTGVVAGTIAAALGFLGIYLGLKALGGGKLSVLSIVTGVFAVVMAFSMTYLSVVSIHSIREEALTTDQAPLIAEYAKNDHLGVMGFLMAVPKDEGSINAVLDEINHLSRLEAQEKGQTLAGTGMAAEEKA